MDANIVLEWFDYDLMRDDILYIKSRMGYTYRDIGKMAGCHPQSVYKFLSGEYSTLGKNLRWKFGRFVQAHYPDFPRRFSVKNIGSARYVVRLVQKSYLDATGAVMTVFEDD